MRKPYKYTKEIIQEAVTDSRTYADCLRKLGLRIAGGNYKLLQRNIDLFNINVSHLTYLSVNQGDEIKSFEDLTRPHSIKTRLIKELGHICQSCNLSQWLTKVITLELEHIDGNNRNNERSNLTLLCPNCHSFTKTWRNRKR